MKLNKVVQTAVKLAPIVIPIVKKMLDEKKKPSPTPSKPTKRP